LADPRGAAADPQVQQMLASMKHLGDFLSGYAKEQGTPSQATG
jgi:hypothetical protein